MTVRRVQFPRLSGGRPQHHLTDLHGRTAVVTGGAAGIGYFTAETLAAMGAHVVIAGSSADRAHAARRAIHSLGGRHRG